MAGAIVPAAILAGLIGTVCLTVTFMAAALWAGEFSTFSLEGLLGALVFTGMFIAIGSIGGTFVVAFYLVIFGLPVALLLGERIRTPAGLLAAMTTGLVAAYAANRWMWGMPSVSGQPSAWEGAIVLCFVLPAAWFYRKQVIAMLDELPA
jgi:hypothetical protein